MAASISATALSKPGGTGTGDAGRVVVGAARDRVVVTGDVGAVVVDAGSGGTVIVVGTSGGATGRSD